MPLIKPGPWSANPADVDPQFLGLWRGLTYVAPMWESSGSRFYDLVSKTETTLNNGAVQTPGGLGQGLTFPNSNSNISFTPTSNQFSAQATVMIVATWDGTTTVQNLMDSTPSGDRYIIFKATGGSTFSVHIDTTFVLNTGVGMVAGEPFVMILTWDTDADDHHLYFNGDEKAQSSTAVNNATPTSHIVGSRFNAVDPWLGWMGGYVMWDRVLSTTEIRLLALDPFGFIRLVPVVTEAEAVSGTGAIAEQSDDASGVGTVLVSGSGAISELTDDATGTGTILVSGAGAISEQADSASGAGNVLVSGAGAVAEQPDDATGAGTSGVLGSGAITEQPDNATGIGTSEAVAARIVAVSVIGRPRASAISKRRIKVTDRNRVT